MRLGGPFADGSKVDRAHYAPQNPYRDEPQPIGHRATISAPHMHAAACESLLPYLNPGAKVLDIGCGSGYLTHVLAQLVQPGGTVIGIDHIQALVDMANVNTTKSADGRQLLDQGRIRYIAGDGRQGVSSELQGFDAIHVGAASRGFPEHLIEQLKAPGRMFVPVEGDDQMQHIYIVDKLEDGSVVKKKDIGVRYVPLTDAPA